MKMNNVKTRNPVVKSLSLDEKIWDWIDEKAALMRMERTAFVQELIADIAGLVEFQRPKISMKDVTKK
jgi:hypothetical protein